MISFFERFLPELSAEQKAIIESSFKREVFKKKELLFMSGQTNTKHYIIEKGLLRLYVIDNNGKEFNILFAKENQIIGDLATPNATSFNLDAIENTVVYSITDEKFLLLSQSLDAVFGAGNDTVLRRSYVFLQRRLVDILTKTAEENYAQFRDINPDLIQRLPQYHIASYLGVSAEFLSKSITKNIKKVKK